MRLVGIFSLATGALLARGVGSAADGERKLFASDLFPVFENGDIALRDRRFSGYGMTALLHTRGVHTVTRRHARLCVSITEVRRFGAGDRLVRWTKPKKPNAGFSETEWKALPGSLEVRLVTVRIDIPGERTTVYYDHDHVAGREALQCRGACGALPSALGRGALLSPHQDDDGIR